MVCRAIAITPFSRCAARYSAVLFCEQLWALGSFVESLGARVILFFRGVKDAARSSDLAASVARKIRQRDFTSQGQRKALEAKAGGNGLGSNFYI
jgi:hypothetical protein